MRNILRLFKQITKKKKIWGFCFPRYIYILLCVYVRDGLLFFFSCFSSLILGVLIFLFLIQIRCPSSTMFVRICGDLGVSCVFAGTLFSFLEFENCDTWCFCTHSNDFPSFQRFLSLFFCFSYLRRVRWKLNRALSLFFPLSLYCLLAFDVAEKKKTKQRKKTLNTRSWYSISLFLSNVLQEISASTPLF